MVKLMDVNQIIFIYNKSLLLLLLNASYNKANKHATERSKQSWKQWENQEDTAIEIEREWEKDGKRGRMLTARTSIAHQFHYYVRTKTLPDQQNHLKRIPNKSDQLIPTRATCWDSEQNANVCRGEAKTRRVQTQSPSPHPKKWKTVDGGGSEKKRQNIVETQPILFRFVFLSIHFCFCSCLHCVLGVFHFVV